MYSNSIYNNLSIENNSKCDTYSNNSPKSSRSPSPKNQYLISDLDSKSNEEHPPNYLMNNQRFSPNLLEIPFLLKLFWALSLSSFLVLLFTPSSNKSKFLIFILFCLVVVFSIWIFFMKLTFNDATYFYSYPSINNNSS